MNEDETLMTDGAEAETGKKRRGGRKVKAEGQEAAAAKALAVYVQYQESEVEVDELIERAREVFREEHKRTPIKELRLYVKPEERAAYYVINDKVDGKLEY